MAVLLPVQPNNTMLGAITSGSVGLPERVYSSLAMASGTDPSPGSGGNFPGTGKP